MNDDKTIEATIHARTIARRARKDAEEVGLPCKKLKVTEDVSPTSHTVTITVTLDVRKSKYAEPEQVVQKDNGLGNLFR